MENNETFLAVKKSNMGIGLKSIEILIISQIDEYTRNGYDCYITNKQFSEMFGESERSIVRAIEKLDDMQIIKRDTKYVSGNGRGNRQRVLTLNDRYKWKIDDNGNANMTPPLDNGNANMTQPLYDGNANMTLPSPNGNAKSDEWKRHNGVIKDNLKENLSKRKDGADAPEKNKKEDAKLLENFSKQDLWDIQNDFKNQVEYKELHNKYGIDWKYLNKNLGNNIQNILNNIKKEEITRQVFDEFEYMPVYLTPEERESRFLRSRALRKAKEENNDDKAMTAW